MTFHFLLPLYHLVTQLPSQVFLLALPIAAVTTGWLWHRYSPQPTVLFWKNPALWCLLGFAAFDWLLLAALPWLGLSFGPPGAPLAGMVAIRSAVIVIFLAGFWVAGRVPGEAAAHLAAKAPVFLLAANFIILACEFEALYIEPFRLQTTNIELSAPSLFTETNSPRLRIVQLSDTHVERTTRRERDLIEQVNALAPDLILLTGDYVNLSYLYDPQAQRDTQALLSQLHAPYGVYAITGSVDHPAVVSPVFDGLAITLLDDEIQRITLPDGDLYLVGVADHWLDRDRDALRHLMQSVPTDSYSILLYHTPDLAETAAETGVDLVLSGHTHGGQIRIPFYGALFTNSIFGKKYEMGRYEIGATTLYVSRGLGMEGSLAPRARFLCPPEIVVFDLIP